MLAKLVNKVIKSWSKVSHYEMEGINWRSSYTQKMSNLKLKSIERECVLYFSSHEEELKFRVKCLIIIQLAISNLHP